MASVYNRGSRSAPRWYSRVRLLDGTWRAYPTSANGKEQAKEIANEQQQRADKGLPPVAREESDLSGELIEKWIAGLTNRNSADDRTRARRHLIPKFGNIAPQAITLTAVLDWLDEMAKGEAPIATATDKRKRAAKLSSGSRRANLNLLSRWQSWLVERGTIAVNVVRQIPTGRRPQQAAKSDVPYIADDTITREIFHRLPSPAHFFFYLGNQSGLRVGEVAGLRIADFGFLEEGVIRVRFQYDGAPLKEDKHGTGKVKFSPAPADIESVIGPWITRRKADGAQPEDLAFPNPHREGKSYQKCFIERQWRDAIESERERLRKEGVEKDPAWLEAWSKLTPYQASRHSFTSRSLERGARLEEVSDALGHHSVTTTQRYYSHLIRRSFSKTLTAGLGLGAKGKGGKVVNIGAGKR